MEHVKVALRVRPMSEKETRQGSDGGWRLDGNQSIEALGGRGPGKAFSFDHVFGEGVGNSELYGTLCKATVLRALEGFDTTIFAYGQTGAGKTFSMLGSSGEEENFSGVIFQAMSDVFNRVAGRGEDEQFVVSCSYLEIYNEEIFDLLAKPGAVGEKLQLFEEPGLGRFRVRGQTKIRVESLEEVRKILKYGENNRRYAETYFNFKSSRSHTIFAANVQLVRQSGEEATHIRESTLSFVDLAGNERLLYEYRNDTRSDKSIEPRRAGSVSVERGGLGSSSHFYNDAERTERANESKNINRSLFYLTQVMHLCSKGAKGSHIPFRNSPLTKLLRSSFGGSSRTLLLLCISPCLHDVEVSLSTLRFGTCAKKIENKVQQNIISSLNQAALQAVVDSYEKKLEAIGSKLQSLEEADKPFISFQNELAAFKAHCVPKLLGLADRIVPSPNSTFSLISPSEGILPSVGILFSPVFFDSKFLSSRSKCLDCLLRKKTEQGAINTLPDLFQTFKSKLETESHLESFSRDRLTEIARFRAKNLDVSKNCLLSISEAFKPLVELSESLADQLHKSRESLALFLDRNILPTLSDSVLEHTRKKLKTMLKLYDEETYKRKFVKEYQLNQSVLDVSLFESSKPTEKLLVKDLASKIDAKISEATLLLSQEGTDNSVKLNEDLTKMVDKIFADNYSIQKSFFEHYEFLKTQLNKYHQKQEYLENQIDQLLSSGRSARERKSLEERNQDMNKKEIRLSDSLAIRNSTSPFSCAENGFNSVLESLSKKVDSLIQYNSKLTELKNIYQGGKSPADPSAIEVPKPQTQENKVEMDISRKKSNSFEEEEAIELNQPSFGQLSAIASNSQIEFGLKKPKLFESAMVHSPEKSQHYQSKSSHEEDRSITHSLVIEQATRGSFKTPPPPSTSKNDTKKKSKSPMKNAPLKSPVPVKSKPGYIKNYFK